MGLDIYLKKVDDFEKSIRLEAEYEAKSEALWNENSKPYNDYTDDEKNAIRAELKQFAESLGLDEWGSYPNERIEIDSTKYPEHYYKIGYLRSSYNNSGINSVMKRAGMPTLYDIFEPDDRAEFQPDWETCLTRAREWLKIYDEYRAREAGKFDVMEIPAQPYHNPPDNEKDAKDIFIQQWLEHKLRGTPIGTGYSNGQGNFYLDGLTVRGFIPGTGWNDRPVMFVIVDWPERANDWYRQAIEITIEMIEWANTQPDKEKLYLVWSS